ncbi:hypothetical protein RJ641_034851 [Dillenia turbinata]|uniref:C2H2-type domain-containing protein n=1 Tax=Dillenia turbinata TaxID=194707 RepID=A0AAN8ZE29_9MAGN
MEDDDFEFSPEGKDQLVGALEQDRETPCEKMGNKRLWIKLKVPKNDGLIEKEDKDDKKDEEEGVQMGNLKICCYCNKGFSSGKALGGHKRVHIHNPKKTHLSPKLRQKSPKKILKRECEIRNASIKGGVDDDRPQTTMKEEAGEEEKTPICYICHKIFPSPKSLYGHMRCHPERNWRGIQPPQGKNSSCSTLSDVVATRKIDDQIDSATTMVGSVTDLSESLKGWAVTDRRGRKGTRMTANAYSSSSAAMEEEEQIPEAAYDLMILAHGVGYVMSNDSDAANSFSRRNDNYAVCEDFDSFNKKRKLENTTGVWEIEKGKEEVVLGNGCDEFVAVGDESYAYSRSTNGSIPGDSTAMSMKIIDLKKKRRKIKMRDLDTVGDFSLPQLQNLTATSSPGKYRCSTCNKSFPTHQALGGHMSSHNKLKNSQTIDEPSIVYPDASAAENEENFGYRVDPICQKMGLVEANGGKHQCTTGQAIGGIENRHCTSPAEAQAVSAGEASETGCRKVLDFDLNELPAMEDEEAIESSAIDHSYHAFVLEILGKKVN